MRKALGDWWQGFIAGGGVAWTVAAALLALFARGTAAIPIAEPLHAQFEADANRVALRIFVIAAAPGFITLSLLALGKRLRKD